MHNFFFWMHSNSMNFYYLIILLPAVLVSAWAQHNVQGTFRRYSTRYNAKNITGAQAARMILDRNGLNSVNIQRVQGSLTDNFDPRANVVHLSKDVYSGTSVAAVGVAAHECGHAVQHATGYFPIRLRNSVIPVSQFGSKLALPLILVGFFLSMSSLVLAGIVMFSLALIFQLVTLPVEFNASARAMRTMQSDGILYGEELNGARRVLTAAALTYLAAMLVSLAYLLQYILIFTGMRRRD
jgi:uncharacterized protein